MGLLSSVTLFGGDQPETFGQIPDAELANAAKGLFTGNGATAQAAGGLLAGVFPYGVPPKRGTRELIQAYKQHPWLRTVLHRIATDCAGIPLRLWAPASKKSAAKALALREAKGTVRKNLLDHAIQAGDLREVTDHPFLDLIGSFNPALRSFSSRMVTQLYLDLKGETFWVLEQNGIGQALEAWPIPPHWVIMTPAWKMPWFRVSWMGWNRQIPEDQVHWIKSPDPENPYWRGTGVGEALGDEVDIDIFAARHIKSWFFNRALPDAIVSVEGLTSEDQAKQYEERLRNKHQGVGKGYQIHVASGKVSVEQLQQTFKEQQMTEVRGLQRDTILQAFNFPPELAGIIENANRATINSAYFLYAAGVLCPRMDFFCDAVQPLVDTWDDRLICDYVSPVPEDHEFKAKIYAASPWAFSKNEVRRLAGDQPLPGGDEEFPPMPSGGGGGLFGDDSGDKPGEGKSPPNSENDDEDEPASKAFRKDVTDNVLDALRPDRLTDSALPVMREQLELWGSRVLGELGSDASFDMKNPMVRHAIDGFAGSRIHHINSTTRDALKSTLSEGVAAGEGIDELKKRVGEVFDGAESWRAENIARTEVTSASSAGNLAAFAMSGVVEAKEWLSVQDSETRDTHKSLDGQVRKLGEMFVADNGDSAEHPGGFGDPAEDCQCRCSVLPRVSATDDEDGKAFKQSTEERVAAFLAHEKSRDPWRSALKAAFKAGFVKQRADVLRALV